MEKLKISNNQRYFEKESGDRFIWLADTAWTLPQRIKWDDVDYYMQTRKAQGFTVLQIVALDPERDILMRNPAGIEALIDGDITKPNENYFSYLDYIVNKAEEYELYVLLLPVWGQLVVGDNWMGETFKKQVTEENAFGYAKWLGNRYKNKKHILWCLGGDRQPIHKGVDYRNVWRKMAEGLAKGITGDDLRYNQQHYKWKELLITYHACHEAETGECSTMSYWTDEEAWISFIMLQSGHGTEPKNYELVKKEYDRKVIMPVWDGEPAYEMMPTTWPVFSDYHGALMVRKRAYWSLFAGSFGHTYGHASVWCSISEREKNDFTKLSWYEALKSEGAGCVKILRDFLEAKNIHQCRPCQEILLMQEQSGAQDINTHVQACINDKQEYICAYFPCDVVEEIDVAALNTSVVFISWFNPRNGECNPIKTITVDETKKIVVTTPDKEDWVLMVATKEQELIIESRKYSNVIEIEKAKKVFDWM
jgi:hypothetical protein